MKPIDLEQVARELDKQIYLNSAELDAKDWPSPLNEARIRAALCRVVREAAVVCVKKADSATNHALALRVESVILEHFGLSEEG